MVNFNEYTNLFAEPRLQEELEPAEGERLMTAFNYDRELSKPWGHPFVFLVKEGELFGKTKERLSNRLNIRGKAFEKIKFSVVPRSGYGKPEYLTDGMYLHYLTVSNLTKFRRYTKRKAHWRRHLGFGSSKQEPYYLWPI